MTWKRARASSNNVQLQFLMNIFFFILFTTLILFWQASVGF